MESSRIPDLNVSTFDDMSWWFAEMSRRELLFHPDDSPNQIFNIRTGEPTFSPEECAKVENILSDMFDKFGNDVHEAAYPIFMRRFNGRLDA
ncbi:hypothetical protein [Dokdonella sp.]|uniref:hypothetical protein n=1 Tax=Dokdonella sp. TaxID=2291710 RepID=UPI002B7B38F9|nr:hypothetical protein [Dokdonella sp.]HPN78227.1 hypothetical protein [Dokdonella sp.]